MLEEQVPRLDDLETRLESMRKELMLARCPVSGLKLLQEHVKAREHAEGSSLQACLRLMVKKKIESRPELVTSKRKFRSSSLTIDRVFTLQAVDQMLSMASVDAVCPGEVEGRASGRFVRYKRHRDALHTMGFSASEAANDMHKNFTRVNGPVSTRLLLEHHVDSDGHVILNGTDRGGDDVQHCAKASPGVERLANAHRPAAETLLCHAAVRFRSH